MGREGTRREARQDETRRVENKHLPKHHTAHAKQRYFNSKRDHIKFETKLVYYMLLTWCDVVWCGVRKSKAWAWAWAIACVLTVCTLCTHFIYSLGYTNTHEILAWNRMTINFCFTFILFLIIGAVTFARLLILFATNRVYLLLAKSMGTQVNGLEHSFVCHYFQKLNKTSSIIAL